MPSQTPLAIALCIVSLAACQKKEQAAATPAAPAPVIKKAVAATPAPVAATDARQTEIDRITASVDRWGGDETILDRAEKELVALLATDRGYAPAYAALGRIEMFRGYVAYGAWEPEALTRATKLLSHALKLDPNLFSAHLTTAWVARHGGDLDLARQSFERADEIQPGHYRVKLGYASLAEADRDWPQVARLAKEILESATEPHARLAAYGDLVDVYWRGGHLDEADAAYREIIKLDPQSAWAHGNYAAFLLQRGDDIGAVREAEAALKIRRYPHAVNTLARACLARATSLWDDGQFAEAGKTLERVADLAGDDPGIYSGLGLFYERAAVRAKDQALFDKARTWYSKALALDPGNRELERTVERMARR